MPRLSEEQLIKRLNNAKNGITIGALYKHYKGGEYKVLDLVIMTESNDKIGVVYQAQYGNKLIFVRPAEMWGETIQHDGQTTLRFTKMK